MIISLVASVIFFLLILSIVVIIHEAGHYFVAKKLGIKVEEFGFGFPPRAIGKKVGETLYSINWLPLGGFVKLYGEDEAGGGRISPKSQIPNPKETKDLGRAFFARPAWQRASVIVAGVVMNLLLSFVIFYIFLFASGFKSKLPLIIENNFAFSNQKTSASVYAGAVEKDSPAGNAGIKVADRFVEVNNKKVTDDAFFRNEINKNRGRKVTVIVDRNGKTQSFILTPRVNPPKGQGAMGVGLFGYSEVLISYDTPTQKFFSGITYPINLLVYNLRGIAHIVGTSVHQKNIAPVSENVSGPLGIFVVVGTVIASSPNVEQAFLQALNIIGLISISLAFFNVLPIPALDGGRLFFVLIEMVTKKKMNPHKEAFINNIAFILLLGMVILVSVFFDLPKLSSFLSFLKK